jgi:hypothetical protein
MIVAVGGPGPVFRVRHEASGDGVLVHVVELFDALVVGEDVEVVVTDLPEGSWGGELGDGELEGLDGFGKRLGFGFAQEKVDVFGHDDVAEDIEVVASAGGFEGFEEEVAGGGGVEVGEAVITTEGEEVVVAFSLIAMEALGHGGIVRLPSRVVALRPTLGAVKRCAEGGAPTSSMARKVGRSHSVAATICK